MLQGKGETSLQLFYKVYLSLEGTDRLHFIALQKERRYIPEASRFKVTKVPEDPLVYHPPEHPLAQPLIDAADTIYWYKKKFGPITEAYRQRTRRRLEKNNNAGTCIPEDKEPHPEPEKPPDRKRREQSKELDRFAREHPPRETKKKLTVECCPGKRLLDVSRVQDPAIAAEYVDDLKKRSSKAARLREMNTKIHTALTTGAWEQLMKRQDASFDEALAARVLDQSRYEKKMMRKLCEVRDFRYRVTENRRIADAMLLEAKENELRLRQARRRERRSDELENVEMEACRMRELRRRIHEEKVSER